MKWKKFFKGLGVVAGSMATVAAGGAIDQVANAGTMDPAKLKTAAAMGAASALFAWWMKSPKESKDAKPKNQAE